MSSTGDEFEFIDRIRRGSSVHRNVPVGIGDDASVISVGEGDARLLVTTDVLMEDVHFDLSQHTPQQAGRKALAVNLSDLAAMAGRATAAFVGLVLPRSRGITFAEELMQGLQDLASEYDVTVAGGDTNIWDGPTVVSVTLLGEPTGRGPVLRSGARPGDWLMVTGQLGGSLVSGRHLSFTPRVREAEALNAALDLHAMIDLSDGLASDIRHLLAESNVGARIDALSIPVHADVDASLTDQQRRERALGDGEDFELLFALSAEDGQQLLRSPLFEVPVTKIGEITSAEGCWLEERDGTRTPLEPGGWEHRFG